MASSFGNTLRSLERRERWGLWLIPAVLVLVGWGTWMLLATISVYASAPRARIEVSHVPSRVAAESGGRLVYLRLELGASVERGELLLELDASVHRARLAEQLAELRTLQAKRRGVEEQLLVERAKRPARRRLGELATARAELGLRHAEVVLSHRAELARIVDELHREQLNTKVDSVNADGELRESHIAVAGAATDIELLSAEHEYAERVELARIAELERELIDLDGARVATGAAIETSKAQLAQLSIYAPASGVVGHIAPIQVGDIVQPGQVLATIVPPDDVRVVAHFPPGEAVGRILPGQPARLRLEGFSWMEFGMLHATVAQSASEPADGMIRVELNLSEADTARIPMQHGLTGSVDIRIEETSPWALLQRSIGSHLTDDADAEVDPAAARLARESRP